MSTSKGHKEILNPVHAIYKHSAEWWTEHLEERLVEEDERASEICNSPIEKAFYLAWRTLHVQKKVTGAPVGGEYVLVMLDNRECKTIDNTEWVENSFPDQVLSVDVMIPQFKLDDYRGDFVIRRFEREHKKQFFAGPKILIECDGHDFHERTKEQASHDKSRDRAFSAAGFVVLRFTGSEIWKDPMACAMQVEDLIEDRICAAVVERRNILKNWKAQ